MNGYFKVHGVHPQPPLWKVVAIKVVVSQSLHAGGLGIENSVCFT